MPDPRTTASSFPRALLVPLLAPDSISSSCTPQHHVAGRNECRDQKRPADRIDHDRQPGDGVREQQRTDRAGQHEQKRRRHRIRHA
jgi:hypothetical protein